MGLTMDELYDLSHVKWDALNDRIIQQSPLGCHFTHISCGNEVGCDEMMPNRGDVRQMFGLEVHYMSFVVNFPLRFPLVSNLSTSR